MHMAWADALRGENTTAHPAMMIGQMDWLFMVPREPCLPIALALKFTRIANHMTCPMNHLLGVNLPNNCPCKIEKCPHRMRQPSTSPILLDVSDPGKNRPPTLPSGIALPSFPTWVTLHTKRE